MIHRRSGSNTAFGARTATRLIAVVMLALLTMLLSFLPAFAPIQNALLLILTPPQRAVVAVASPVADLFQHFGEFGQISRGNEELRAQNEELSVQLAALREKEASFNDLSRLLQADSSHLGGRVVTASIVSRASGRYQRAVAINHGANDGIRADMVVLSPSGTMIGRVSSVTADFAWVTLLTDPSSKIPALIQDGRFDGILVGRANNRLSLEMLPQGSSVKPGDLVVTSGLDGTFPKGLPLGRVIEVSGSGQVLFPSVYVEPLSNLTGLEHVVVVMDLAPGGVPSYPGPGGTTAPPRAAEAAATVSPDRKVPEAAAPTSRGP